MKMKSSGAKLNRCGGCKLPTYAGGIPRTPPNTNLITNQEEKTKRIPGDLSRESMACKSALPGRAAPIIRVLAVAIPNNLQYRPRGHPQANNYC